MSIAQQIEKPYQVITDRILALLEQGTVPWHQPWDSVTGLPRNLFSQRPYRGINVWMLTAMGYASPFWATFNQVKTAGGSVRKGERGVPVVFWKVYIKEDQETGDEEQRFVLRYFTVFNAAQLDGVAVPEILGTPDRFTPIERCEQLVSAMPNRPTIIEGHQRAFYQPATDTLHMPIPQCFQSPEAYYAILLHELTHSTGHQSRLNRKTMTDLCLFGSPTYAKEELVAEMGAAYLCGVCGIANATSTTAPPTSRAGCRSCATTRPCWSMRQRRPKKRPITSKTCHPRWVRSAPQRQDGRRRSPPAPSTIYNHGGVYESLLLPRTQPALHGRRRLG
jgi:antirestriction protein ArdC